MIHGIICRLVLRKTARAAQDIVMRQSGRGLIRRKGCNAAMLRQFSTRRVLGFFLWDWLGTLAMLALASVLRVPLGQLPGPLAATLQAMRISQGGLKPVATEIGQLPIEVFGLVAVIWPFFFNAFSVYDGRRNETLKAELLNVLLAIGVAVMTLAGMLYFTYRETSRVLFLVFFGLDVALLLGSRIVLWAYRARHSSAKRIRRRPVLVVGAGSVGQEVVRQLAKYAWADVDLVGYVDDDPAKFGQEYLDIPVLGTLDQIPDVVLAYDVHDAVVALPLDAHLRLVETCKALQGLAVHIYVIPDLFALSFPGATLDGFGGIPVIDLGQPGLYGRRRQLKRAFDVLAVSIGLALISPLLACIAIAIKLDSRGPVLYRQKRIGERGRPFTMWKFRSMRVDADPKLHRAHVARLIQENVSLEQLGGNGNGSLKMENDPRVTRVGWLIRKTSLDELPQLFNVLRGEMSLVGPRPPIAYEVELYQEWHMRRLDAIPGMTGLWQVKGRNRVSFDEMVRMDLEYIEKQSLWQDIKILLQTPLAVITGRGAG
jgi:exopolysaccharide biosynthesis polyprenyl glycosylphosphotransferase